MNKIFTCLICCFITLSPLAAQSPITKERTREALQNGYEEIQDDDEFYSAIMNLVFALGFIIFVMIIAAYYLKKYMQGRVEHINVTSAIKVIEQRNLSAKSVLYVVEVYGKKVLVGESVAGVVGLAELPNTGKSFEEVYEQTPRT